MNNKNDHNQPEMEEQIKNTEGEAGGNESSEKQKDTKKTRDTKKAEKKSKSAKKSKSSVEAELQDKVNELNDKFLRLYSEFDNYRRRTSKERLDLLKTASEEVITELLPVLDDFERAFKSSESSEETDTLKEGMLLIYNKFKGTLTKKGLLAIEATGKDFDTDYHEAITYIPAPSEDLKGKVVDEVEKGYMLNEKVIRYAKVVLGQ